MTLGPRIQLETRNRSIIPDSRTGAGASSRTCFQIARASRSGSGLAGAGAPRRAYPQSSDKLTARRVGQARGRTVAPRFRLGGRDASVSAAYRGRLEGQHWIAWDERGRPFKKPGRGRQVIGGNGFGCVILRRSLLREPDPDQRQGQWGSRRREILRKAADHCSIVKLEVDRRRDCSHRRR